MHFTGFYGPGGPNPGPNAGKGAPSATGGFFGAGDQLIVLHSSTLIRRMQIFFNLFVGVVTLGIVTLGVVTGAHVRT